MLALACFLGKLNELGYEEGQTLIDGIDNYADNSDGNEHDTRILKNCFCTGPCNLLDFASEVFPKLLKALAETLEGIPVGILRLSGLRLGLFGLSDFLGRSKLGVIGALLGLFFGLGNLCGGRGVLFFAILIPPDLLRFFVESMLPAETAVLVHLQPVRCVLLVFNSVVVALLAFCASKSNLYSHDGTSNIIGFD